MHAIQALIADIDGTLLNTVGVVRKGQYQAFKAHMEELGITQHLPEYDEYLVALHRVVGGHVRETLESTAKLLLSADKSEVLARLDFDRMVELLKVIQDDLAATDVQSYEGFGDLCRSLGKNGQKLGMFTSGKRHHVVRNMGVALPELGIQQLYKDSEKTDEEKIRILETALQKTYGIGEVEIVTVQDVKTYKPNPEPVLCVLERLGLGPEQVVAIGDHTVDMMAAKAAGVPSRLGITHGFDDENLLLTAGATRIVHSLVEVKEYLHGV